MVTMIPPYPRAYTERSEKPILNTLEGVMDRALLETDAVAAIPEHAVLDLSTCGELVAVTDQGAIRIAVGEPEHWFTGHLA